MENQNGSIQIDKQKVIEQMTKIAYGDRIAISVFSNSELDKNVNLNLVKLLADRATICQHYILTPRIDSKENTIELFESYNEQIKQILGL